MTESNAAIYGRKTRAPEGPELGRRLRRGAGFVLRQYKSANIPITILTLLQFAPMHGSCPVARGLNVGLYRLEFI
jgi:hypothetical protein